MLSVSFQGRLGNQLFQVAKIVSDSAEYKIPYTAKGFKYLEYFPNLTNLEFPRLPFIVYHENGHSYNKFPTPDPSKNNFFVGYFQTEKYFIKHQKIIRKALSFKKEIQDEIDRLCDSFKDYTLISVHVRHGDYLNLQDYHPILSKEYYSEAISHINVPNPLYLVFSDDINWCKQNLNFGPVKYEDELVDSPIKVLCLMTKCKYHIIANSSFSWWGAWLSNSVKVIRPKIWFGPNLSHLQINDLCPNHWILV